MTGRKSNTIVDVSCFPVDVSQREVNTWLQFSSVKLSNQGALAVNINELVADTIPRADSALKVYFLLLNAFIFFLK